MREINDKRIRGVLASRLKKCIADCASVTLKARAKAEDQTSADELLDDLGVIAELIDEIEKDYLSPDR